MTSDLEMIKHITENHSDPQTSGSQGKEPGVKNDHLSSFTGATV